MSHFIAELRKAHAVFTAHASGARTLPQLVKKTGLEESICAEWVQLLRLKIAPSRPPKLEFDI